MGSGKEDRLLKTIDLNADLGEGCPWDSTLLPLVSSASIACGGHAGDALVMDQTLRAAQRWSVSIGAHPGYPDRENFGRSEREASAEDVRRLILDQWESLQHVAARLTIPVRYIKPHGALYHQAQYSEPHARGTVQAASDLGTAVLGMLGGLVERYAAQDGVRFVAEGFADRRYRPDGSLVPRSESGAVLDDPAEVAEQVIALVGRGIETICIHGDHPGSVTLAVRVRETFDHAGIVVRSAF
jgi:UPF0271 protein